MTIMRKKIRKGDQMKSKMMLTKSMINMKWVLVILGIIGILMVSSCSKNAEPQPVQPIVQESLPPVAEEQDTQEKSQGTDDTKTQVVDAAQEEIQEIPLDDLDMLNIDEVDALDEGVADAEELITSTVE